MYIHDLYVACKRVHIKSDSGFRPAATPQNLWSCPWTSWRRNMTRSGFKNVWFPANNSVHYPSRLFQTNLLGNHQNHQIQIYLDSEFIFFFIIRIIRFFLTESSRASHTLRTASLPSSKGLAVDSHHIDIAAS